MKFTDLLTIPNREKLHENEVRRLRLVLIVNSISILSTLFYILVYWLIDYSSLWPMIIHLVCYIPLFLLSILLVKKSKFLLAKLTVLLCTVASTWLGSMLFLGTAQGLHYYFLLFSLLPIIIFSGEQKRYIIFFFLLNISGFLIAEFSVEQANILLSIPEKYEQFLRILANITTFVLIAMVVILYQRLAEANENRLQKQTDELEELIRTKDKFFSIIAHDLRNPFNILITTSELLKLRYERYSDEKRLSQINAIHKSSVSAHQLLENLLIWSQLQSKKIQVYYEDQDLSVIVQNCLHLYEEGIKKKKIEIVLDLEDNLRFKTDKYILHLVIRNLISNALKFTPEGKSISIATKLTETLDVEIIVTDEGIGMSEEDLDNLFHIDKSIHTTSSIHKKGSGLGLILCKESLAKIEGEISVESSLGKGSSFTVLLPYVA